MILVPLGNLWSLPWPGVPIGDGLFGELAELAVVPSLTVYRRLAQRRPLVRGPSPLSIATWRSPEVQGHELDIFGDARWHHQPLGTAPLAHDAVINARTQVTVVAGHGLPVPGLGHYMELASGVVLTPADLIGARTSPQLVLVSCWGAATPAPPVADPLTLATLALAAGSLQVAATTAELGDRGPATRLVEEFLHRLPDLSMPAALRQARGRLLVDPAVRHGPLRDWATLSTLGLL